MNNSVLCLDLRALFAFDRAALNLTKPTLGIAIVLVATRVVIDADTTISPILV